MKKTEYRRRKTANDYRRKVLERHGIKLTMMQAYKETGAIEKVCRVLGPLSPAKRSKVYRMLQIAFEPEPKVRE